MRWNLARTRPRAGRGHAERLAVVGDGAASVTAALARGRWEVAATGIRDLTAEHDVLVILDPELHPKHLPRGPLRVGLVLPGRSTAWSASELLEDVDVLLTTEPTDSLPSSHRLRRLAVAIPEPTELGRLAEDLARSLAALHRRPSVAIITGVSKVGMRSRWGDHHYAVGMAKAFVRAGWAPRVWSQGELDVPDLSSVDLVVYLAGKVSLAPVRGVPTVAWIISHPSRHAADDLRLLTHVHVASEPFARLLVERGVEASVLHQATDTDRFRPSPGGVPHDLLFVANSRGVRRRILDDLLPTDHALAVYGYGWTADLLDPRLLHGDHVPNDRLAAAYTAAKVVLNDHWDDMRELGFPSNRLFDASACGAAVVSDHVEGVDRLFGGAIVTYRSRSELRSQVERLLGDEGLRRELGARASEITHRRHSFDHRVAELLSGLADRIPGATSSR